MVGLVASRLKEKFSRPAFAIALEPGGIGTGSGRSIAGVDLGKAVRQAVTDGSAEGRRSRHGRGRHACARRGWRNSAPIMENALAHDVAQSRHVNELFIDGAVSARAVTPELAATLNRAGPFGSGNPEPVVALPSHQLVYADEVGQAHLRLRFKSGDGAIVNGIAFRSVGQKLGNALTHIAASRCMSRDRWRSIAGRAPSACNCACIDVAVPDQGRR